jgi:hypothetical protein
MPAGETVKVLGVATAREGDEVEGDLVASPCPPMKS